MRRPEAIALIKSFMNEHLNSTFQKGVCDVGRTIKDANEYSINVDTKTTALLHFLTNSLLMGLDSLGILGDKLQTVFGKIPVTEELQCRLKENFDFFKGVYKDVEPPLLINSLLDGLTDAPFGSRNKTSFR